MEKLKDHWNQSPMSKTPHQPVEQPARKHIFPKQLKFLGIEKAQKIELKTRKTKSENCGSKSNTYGGELRRRRRVESVVGRRVLIQQRRKVHYFCSMEPFDIV